MQGNGGRTVRFPGSRGAGTPLIDSVGPPQPPPQPLAANSTGTAPGPLEPQSKLSGKRPASPPSRPLNRIRQLIRARPRLFVAIGLGIVSEFLLPEPWRPVTRLLGAWNIFAWSYLLLAGWLMLFAPAGHVREFAEREDRGAAAILAFMSLAALASLAAIVLELTSTKDLDLTHRLLHYGLTGATVFGSWCVVGTMFAFHYARSYYRSQPTRRALRFPDDEMQPDYWDFLYFSFTIAVAAQTSDISVMSRTLRKAVLAQSVLSFLFNAAIIGLSINIAAGLVGS